MTSAPPTQNTASPAPTGRPSSISSAKAAQLLLELFVQFDFAAGGEGLALPLQVGGLAVEGLVEHGRFLWVHGHGVV